METYRLKFLETQYAIAEERQQQEQLSEIKGFIDSMQGRSLAVVTLEQSQSGQWGHSGEFDYQDYYGQEIIIQVAGGTTDPRFRGMAHR